jgi:AraC-like DNA-binding protein
MENASEILQSDYDVGPSAAEYYDQLVERFDSIRKQEDIQLIGEIIVLSRSEYSSVGVSLTVLDLESNGRFELEFTGEGLQIALVLESVGGRLFASSSGSSHCVEHDFFGASAIVVGGHGAPASLSGKDVSLLKCLVLSIAINDVCENAELLAHVSQLKSAVRLASPALLKLAKVTEQVCRAGASSGSDEVIAELLQNIVVAPVVGTRAGGLAPWQTRKLRTYLHENLSRSVLLKELAKETRLSQSHFCRAFRSTFGFAPHQWVLMARCRQAKVLLLDRSRSLVEIALDVGFSDQSHFTRAFGRLMGVQPGVWRRAHATW